MGRLRFAFLSQTFCHGLRALAYGTLDCVQIHEIHRIKIICELLTRLRNESKIETGSYHYQLLNADFDNCRAVRSLEGASTDVRSDD